MGEIAAEAGHASFFTSARKMASPSAASLRVRFSGGNKRNTRLPDGIVIKPAVIVANEALDEIGAALKAKGIKLEDLLERGREIRSELAREKYGPAKHKR